MRRFGVPTVLIVAGLGLIVLYVVQREPVGQSDIAASGEVADSVANAPPAGPEAAATPSVMPDGTPSPSVTPQPIFPSRTPDASPMNDSTPLAAGAGAATIREIGSAHCSSNDCGPRFGVSGYSADVAAAFEAGLPFGNYFNWRLDTIPPRPGGAQFWQMVRVRREGPVPSWEEIEAAILAQPGSIWVVGNEPDIIWQDDVPAERYAEIYHDVYSFIKEHDEDATVAIAGVGQPTPLRRAYLDIVLDTYQERFGEPMPVDIWTVHGFILREEAGSWGVGIPPGMEQSSGRLYEIQDHANLNIFRQNLIDFRAWMARRGYGDRPLAVTELGVLHPSDYGFPTEVVADFMTGVFDFMLEAANETGYPADDGRLVQWWFWFSVQDEGDYPTGNLFDRSGGRLTALGEVFSSYVKGE